MQLKLPREYLLSSIHRLKINLWVAKTKLSENDNANSHPLRNPLPVTTYLRVPVTVVQDDNVGGGQTG